MDTEKYVLVNEETMKDFENVNYIDGSAEELSDIIDYIELTRYLQEIYQWFDIFNYDLHCLRESMNREEKIAINSNMISLLSSGKNLIDSIEGCIRYNCTEKEYKVFKRECISEEYDKCFSYRFMIRLRNYTQHNHIPISHHDNSICFDLMQIYNTPHYCFNKTLKKEISGFMEEVTEKCNENLKISIPPTVSSYVCSVYKIYKKFLNSIRLELINKHNKCYEIFDENPELVKQKDNERFGNCLFYTISEEENFIHAFNTKEDSEGLLVERKNQVIEYIKSEIHNVKELKKTLNIFNNKGDTVSGSVPSSYKSSN